MGRGTAALPHASWKGAQVSRKSKAGMWQRGLVVTSEGSSRKDMAAVCLPSLAVLLKPGQGNATCPSAEPRASSEGATRSVNDHI